MSLYEPAIEPECPRPEYDPAMDIPEPPAPRRKPPFVTSKNEHGKIHRLPSRHIYTGRHEYGKWAGIDLPGEDYAPIIFCDRKTVAAHLRYIRNQSRK